MVEKLLKRKSALLLTLGSTAGFLIGGVIAWGLLQKRPTLVGMPPGAEIIPQDTAMLLSFTTNRGQWQQVRRFGTPDSQATFDQKLAQFRDRLLIANGLNYQRDIQPWVGSEITTAFLLPAAGQGQGNQKVTPYDPAALAAGQQSTVMVLPIADPAKAQQLFATPRVAAGQDWVDRDYRGVKIREVQGAERRAYAAAVLDSRFVVASNDPKAVERVIDTFKGKPSVAQTSGYSQALSHIATTDPFMQVYVNLPAATAITASNTSQPIPPQLLLPLKANQGLAGTVSLEPDGLRFQAVSWLAANRRTRFKVTNSAERMPLLLPTDTLFAITGGNLKQSWQTYAQLPEAQPNGQIVPAQGLLDPDRLRRSVTNLTGLDLDQDLINWMNGEFSLALIATPEGGTNSTPKPLPESASPESDSEASPSPEAGLSRAALAGSKAGVVLITQTNDRKAAEESFKKLDELVKTRYRFTVKQTQVGDKPVTQWVSPFGSLTLSHGWLDGNVAFLAIGSDLASTFLPSPAKTLADNSLFRQVDSADLKPNNGHFFIDLDRLNANPALPLPKLPPENQAFIEAIRAIGLTAALQDNRTTRYDTHIILRKGDAPKPLPAPALENPSSQVSP
ncbi:MAG: DUF3352 domain-containing protein [Elainella sp.]